MTIINPHDMTRHFTLWGVCLTVPLLALGLMYWFQPVPVVQLFLPSITVPSVIQYVLIGVSGVCAIVAISFKYVFSNELVAWLLLEILVLVGTTAVAFYGYSEWYLLYYGAAFLGVLCFGPYLHFD